MKAEELERIEIEKELANNPELFKLIQAAATLTPEDLEKVVSFATERRRKA